MLLEHLDAKVIVAVTSPTVREASVTSGIINHTPITTLRKLYIKFLSHWMGYDHGDSFPFDFEPNRFPFGSRSYYF